MSKFGESSRVSGHALDKWPYIDSIGSAPNTLDVGGRKAENIGRDDSRGILQSFGNADKLLQKMTVENVARPWKQPDDDCCVTAKSLGNPILNLDIGVFLRELCPPPDLESQVPKLRCEKGGGQEDEGDDGG